MMERKVGLFVFFGILLFAGIILVLVLQINQSNTATDERVRNRESIQASLALSCQRIVSDTQIRDLLATLTTKGAIQIDATCQQYVELLSQELVYDEEQGRITLAQPQE